MKYVELVEEVNKKNLIEGFVSPFSDTPLQEDITAAVELVLPFIKGDEDKVNMKKVKDEIFDEKDAASVANAWNFLQKLDPVFKEKKYSGEKQEKLGQLVGWLTDFFNDVSKQLDDETSKELLIKLKKEKGFKGNVLAIN
jgi:hypothetical protein